MSNPETKGCLLPEWLFKAYRRLLADMYWKVVLIFMLALAVPLSRGANAGALWAGKIQPLLDANCVKCHGPLEQKSGLELDNLEAVMKGGDEGAVVIAGKPEQSRLYKYLAPDSDPHMPPKKQLTDAQRELVREWITAIEAKPPKVDTKAKGARRFESVTQAIDELIAE